MHFQVTDHVMGKTSAEGMCGASHGQIHLADLDYTDDVAILAEILQVVHLALEMSL